MAERPHALLIAWAFPPSRSSGVYRALATANALVHGGFDVTVLTCEREAFVHHTGVDEDLEGHVDPAVAIVRIPFEWPQNDPNIRRWSRRRARDPLRWRDERNEADVRGFPEVIYGPWLEPLLQAAEEIHARRPVDLTIGTANPNVDVEAARHLKLRHGVPYVLDQRDGWSLNTFTGERTEKSRVLECEANQVREATECWYVNQPLRDWHAAEFDAPERAYVVSNGYDPAFAPAPRLRPVEPGAGVRFGYVGTITRAVAFKEFVDGWLHGQAHDPRMRDATADLWGYLGFSSTPDADLMTEIVRAGTSGLRYRGPLARTAVGPAYQDFDALLLLLGSGRFVTSGKVFEYMASGLPIVSVHDADLDASRVLADYPLWFPASSLAPEDVAAALGAAAHAARTADEATRRDCVTKARRWERSRQLGPRVAALRAHVEGRSRR